MAYQSYHDAYKKEFWTLKGPRTEHIRHIKLSGDIHNNKMERMNGEVRDREKTLRGLKNDDISNTFRLSTLSQLSSDHMKP